jgi:hypothetical protein
LEPEAEARLGAELKVRIHFPPAESHANPIFGSTCSRKCLKLTVNQEKARICRVPDGEFDFCCYGKPGLPLARVMA